VILIVICFSCCVFVIQTLPQFHARHPDLLYGTHSISTPSARVFASLRSTRRSVLLSQLGA
jgi:hypothetical protein